MKAVLPAPARPLMIGRLIDDWPAAFGVDVTNVVDLEAGH